MYFIMFFILKSPPPPFPTHHVPFATFCNHVVHSKLPGFAPTPDMYMYKIKTKIKRVQMLHKHPTTLWQLRSVAQLVPVFVSMDMVGQLDVPWLNCIPLGMDGE